MNKNKLLFIWIIIFLPVLSNAVSINQFQLKPGDLLFQDLNCGSMCDSIDSVTYGYGQTYISHVAMVVSIHPPEVVEAVSAGVSITPLARFLKRSLDNESNPRVMVGRLKQQYQQLIPQAIKVAVNQVGKPYNASFVPANGKAFYCTELIDYSVRQANHQHILFHSAPMDFTDGKSKAILPLWESYYHGLHVQVPQGIPGTNPGAMSRESMLQIVYYYGQLRKH